MVRGYREVPVNLSELVVAKYFECDCYVINLNAWNLLGFILRATSESNKKVARFLRVKRRRNSLRGRLLRIDKDCKSGEKEGPKPRAE